MVYPRFGRCGRDSRAPSVHYQTHSQRVWLRPACRLRPNRDVAAGVVPSRRPVQEIVRRISAEVRRARNPPRFFDSGDIPDDNVDRRGADHVNVVSVDPRIHFAVQPASDGVGRGVRANVAGEYGRGELDIRGRAAAERHDFGGSDFLGRVPVEYEDAPERPVSVAVFKQYAGLPALSRPLLLFGGNIGQRAVVGVAYIAGAMKLTSPAPVAGRMANREMRSAPSATMGIHRFLPFTRSLPLLGAPRPLMLMMSDSE